MLQQVSDFHVSLALVANYQLKNLTMINIDQLLLLIYLALLLFYRKINNSLNTNVKFLYVFIYMITSDDA